MDAVGTRNYGMIASLDELREYFDRIHAQDGPIGFDIETGYHGPDREKGAVHPETAIVVGFSFSSSTDWARYVPLAHDRGENLDNYEVAKLLWDLLATGRGVAHNASFELRHLAKFFRQHLWNDPERGGAVRARNGYFPILSDTLVEAYLMAEFERFALKPLTKALFDHTMTELFELFPDLSVNRRKYLRFNTLDLEPRVIEYACEDSLWCLAIHQRYHDAPLKWIAGQPALRDSLLYQVEKAIVEEVLWDMEDEGICYDWTLMRQVAEELKEFRDWYNAEIMADLSDLVDRPIAINLASPKQVGGILFDELGMRTSVYTKGTRDLPPEQRRMSTGDIALQKLAKNHPVVKKILQWRNATKLLGTYLDKYEDKFNYADDGRVHANHLSAWVRTGRFATSDPNYQQCLPGSYEVLTPQGWERLDKLADGVPVAQYESDETIQFVVPSTVVRDRYEGDMIEIEAGRLGRWRYTPNHRLVFRTRRGTRNDRVLSTIRECSAAEWENRIRHQPDVDPRGKKIHDRYFPCAGYAAAETLTAEQFRSLAIATAVQADGSKTQGHQYDIIVYKDRKVQALRDLGLEPRQYADGRWRVRVPTTSVGMWLDENKNFRPSAILSLSSFDLRRFVEEVMRWDGDFVRGKTYKQNVARRQSVEVVQAAAALCGYATSLWEDKKYDAVTVNIHPRPYRESSFQKIKRVPSDGMVYCVTVPSGMFLARNDDGTVQVTGNSPKKYHLDLADAITAHVDGTPAPEGHCFKFNFRDVIIAPADHYILGFDLSQAELRAIAGEAQEHALLEAFANGDDVHRLTASLMLGIPLEDVTEELRGVGKTMNFALLYGMSTKGLADRLAIPIEEAQSLMDKYFAGLPGIAAYIYRQQEFGRNNGYVISKFGRRLPIWEYKSENPFVRQGGDRACVNYPIQGAATGDYMKIAMVQAIRAIRHAGLADKVRLVMNVHDALEFYVHRSLQPQDVIALLQPAVIFPVDGWPAMKADWHVAKRWGSPKEVVVKPDGSIVVKGDVEFELRPSVEVDDEGDAVEVLPEVSEEALREAAKPQFDTGRTVIIRLTSMPEFTHWRAFVERLKELPGYNTVMVVTPDGDIELPFKAGLRPDHLGKVAGLLKDSGLSIKYAIDDLTDDLVSGLNL